VVSEFGSRGSFDGVFAWLLDDWGGGDVVDGFEPKAFMIGWRSLLIVDCGFTGGGGGAGFVVFAVTVGGAGVDVCGAPSASNSRSFCAREIEADDDVFGVAGDENVPFAPSAGSGTKLVRCPRAPPTVPCGAACVDPSTVSVVVLTEYERTRTTSAAANATVRSVRKTDRNEIWTGRRTRKPSIDNARNSESEGCDFRPEGFSAGQTHHVTTLHRAHGGPQRAETGVLE